MTYKFTLKLQAERVEDSAVIPLDPANVDYQKMCLDLINNSNTFQDVNGQALTPEAAKSLLIGGQSMPLKRVIGTIGVDTIVIPEGALLDLSVLGASQDVIIFPGSWYEYTKVVNGTYITFKRLTPLGVETVRVTSGSNPALNDKLTFTEGTVTSYQTRTALNLDPSASIEEIVGFISA